MRSEPGAFKFGITVIGNTALFTRMQKRTRNQISRHSGYRDAFEERYTKIHASAASATSHHRVVKYDFADQTILLRYAVDAYLGDLDKSLMQAHGIEDTDAGPLVKRHKNMTTKQDSSSKILPSNTPVTVIDGGRHVPHAATLELTTRVQHSQAPDSIEQKMPDLWFSQTLNYHLCFHRQTKNGSTRSTIFDCIRLIPTGDLLIGWEKTNAEKLRALAHVLGQVIKAAKELRGSCIVTSDGIDGGSLKVIRAEGEEVPALPEDMQSLFLPIKNEAVDVPMKQEEVAITASTAGQDGTRKRKYGTEDAPELTDSPSAQRRALNSEFRTPGQAVASIKEGGHSVKTEDEPVDIEMSM